MDHHRSAPFNNEGGKKAPNPDPGTTQFDKFLSTDSLNSNYHVLFVLTSTVSPDSFRKYQGGSLYRNLRKEGKRPEESHLTFFE